MSPDSWLGRQLCINRAEREQEIEGYVPDDLLVSSPVGNGFGGLYFIQKSGWLRSARCVVIDRLGTTGIWIGEHCLLRSIDHKSHLVLIQYDSSGKTWPTVRSDLGQIHDVRIFKGKPHAVSTATNEVVRFSWDGEIEERYRFPGEGDAWHLNCLDDWHGRLVVSGFGKFESNEGWRQGATGKGFVMDVISQKILWENLSKPHSPRLDVDGRRLVCDSETQQLFIESATGEISAKQFPGFYIRGLALGSEHIYMGLSCQRYAPGEANAWIVVFDRLSLEEKGQIRLPIREIYDILVC